MEGGVRGRDDGGDEVLEAEGGDADEIGGNEGDPTRQRIRTPRLLIIYHSRQRIDMMRCIVQGDTMREEKVAHGRGGEEEEVAPLAPFLYPRPRARPVA